MTQAWRWHRWIGQACIPRMISCLHACMLPRAGAAGPRGRLALGGSASSRFGGLSIVDDTGMALALQQLAVSLAVSQQRAHERGGAGGAMHVAALQARNQDILMVWTAEQVGRRIRSLLACPVIFRHDLPFLA